MSLSDSHIRTVFFSAALILVSGCAGVSSRYAAQASVDPASIIQINREFEIPNEKARVYIQNGIQTTKQNIEKYLTYCSVLMQNIHVGDDPKQTVSPGLFDITKVIQSNDYIYLPRVFVASRFWTYDRPSNVLFEVEMRLNSIEQPDVRSLICVKRVDDYRHHYSGRNYPSLAEIEIALGAAITIKSLE